MNIPLLQRQFYCRFGLFITLTAVLSVAGFATSIVPPPPTVRWETDFNVAMARAERENRPLFLHFVGTDCPPTQQMANEVFTKPNIIAQLNDNFVMVKINVHENQTLAQRFAIEKTPTDLIMKSNGQIIHRRMGVISAETFFNGFLAYLLATTQSDKTQVPTSPAASTAAPMGSVPAPLPSGNPPGFPYQAPPSGIVLPHEMVAITDTVREPFGQSQPERRTPPPAMPPNFGNPPEYRQNVADEPAPAKMMIEVPLALDGYCPVMLTTEQRWVPGNQALCTLYLGHIFRFSSLEALKTFAQNPTSFIPVAMGEDVVVMVDQSKRVNGRRDIAGTYEGRVLLFSSEATYSAFAARSHYYMEIIMKYETARREQALPVVY
jgi:thioredoxin-related protein/YHS domain-containing protein